MNVIVIENSGPKRKQFVRITGRAEVVERSAVCALITLDESAATAVFDFL